MEGKAPSCLGRAAVPVKRVWLGLSARLGLRRTTGLGELRKEVRTCEYRDVHVMWEMLGGMDDAPRHDKRKKKKDKNTRKAAAVAAAAWSRVVSYCCACACPDLMDSGSRSFGS
uniref:Uncharacterized protein n=1 Tax=Avena sativa TaxID=4498 RepID=A0ACD5U8L0_AVESA